MNEIELKFLDRGIVRGRTLYLRPDDAIDLVKVCRSANRRVLGLDAAILKENSTQPDMGNSIDLSLNKTDLENCWSLAENFLFEKRSKGFWFEVVID